MTNKTPKGYIVDNPKIMANLFKFSGMEAMSYERVRAGMNDLCFELYKLYQNKVIYPGLKGYRVCCQSDDDSIVRSAIYNNRIFGVDEDAKLFYIRKGVDLKKVCEDEEYYLDDTCKEILKKFAEQTKRRVL